MSARPAKTIRIETEEEGEAPMMMTSMIDVIFILLAFFVCVSEIKKGHLDVDIPEVSDASSESSASTGDPIVVEVTGDDRVSVCGEVAESDDELARLIAQAAERLGKDAQVHLSGDRSAKNGTMMRVVSHLSKAGLKKIEFAVEAGG